MCNILHVYILDSGVRVCYAAFCKDVLHLQVLSLVLLHLYQHVTNDWCCLYVEWINIGVESSSAVRFLLKMLFIFIGKAELWTEEKQRKTPSILSFIHSPNVFNCQSWDNPKPGVRPLSRELDRSRTAGTFQQQSMNLKKKKWKRETGTPKHKEKLSKRVVTVLGQQINLPRRMPTSHIRVPV